MGDKCLVNATYTQYGVAFTGTLWCDLTCPKCHCGINTSANFGEILCPECGEELEIHWADSEDDDGGAAWRYLAMKGEDEYGEV
jgi:predicted amidophosphoribosyltransferase